MTISGTLLGASLLPIPPLFTTGDYTPPSTFTGRSASVTALACTPDGKSFIASGADEILPKWA